MRYDLAARMARFRAAFDPDSWITDLRMPGSAIPEPGQHGISLSEPAVCEEIVVVHRAVLGRALGRASRASNFQHRTESGIKIAIAKCLLERRERWLARAMTGRDPFDFPRILERIRNL